LQLSSLASDYASLCTLPDKNQNSNDEGIVMSSDAANLGARSSCDVYVWGSNSSHQLAEGVQDKIPSPKQTNAFIDVVEVILIFVCFFNDVS
jgi:E3 ubiquitin-protein ligase HERC1